MVRKIKNPFTKLAGYNCFACSPENPIGLKLEFFEEGEDFYCYWEPHHDFEGWNDVLHGGIQATLMDEIASWIVFVKLKTAGVTSRMDVKLKRPALISKGKFKLKAIIKEIKRNIAFIEVDLFDGENVVCANGTLQYYLYPEKIAREKMNFPGPECF